MVSFETLCDKVETCQYSVEISVEYLSQSRPMPRSTGVRGEPADCLHNGPQVPRQADGRPDWSSLEARPIRAQQAHSRTQVSGRGEFRAMMLSKA